MIEKIQKLQRGIESVEVQGATNVALATLEGMALATEIREGDLLENVESVGFDLSTARENEPLARNAVKYVLSSVKETPEDLKKQILTAIDEFETIIKDAKLKIKQNAVETLSPYEVILTHCHSSTTTNALIALSKQKPGLKVVSTETRPLYQGRKTAKELIDHGVDVTQIVDSASASFIVDDRYLPVEAVIVGADEVFKNGDVINKVGSYQIALAAEDGKDELYIATTLLKVDAEKDRSEPNIEMRSAKEVWLEAPEGLSIINPSFEIIPSKLITGYITEAGVLKENELLPALKKMYPWV